MTNRLSKDEFAVLSYLHEHAAAYDESSSFDVIDIAAETYITTKDVGKAVSYLDSLGLVGIAADAYGTFDQEGMTAVYLTGKGEDFMRAVEEALAVQIEQASANIGEPTKKITTKAVDFVYGVGQSIIGNILTAMMMGR